MSKRIDIQVSDPAAVGSSLSHLYPLLREVTRLNLPQNSFLVLLRCRTMPLLEYLHHVNTTIGFFVVGGVGRFYLRARSEKGYKKGGHLIQLFQVFLLP